MPLPGFVDQYEDLSSADGFRFRFFCDRCPKSYEVEPRKSLTEKLIGKATQKLSGTAREVAETAEEIAHRSGGKAGALALAAAIAQIKDRFAECASCGKWVCRESCWNLARGRCETCAPNEDEERLVRDARSIMQREEAEQASRDSQYDRDAVAAKMAKMGITCPSCGKPGKSGTFCNSCGAPLSLDTGCPGCGAKNETGAKFCAGCGKPLP